MEELASLCTSGKAQSFVGMQDVCVTLFSCDTVIPGDF